MADLKISQLTGATTPLAGTEVLPIVQGGATKQVSVANLTAGRAVGASTVQASTGFGVGVTPTYPIQIQQNGTATGLGLSTNTKLLDGSANKGFQIGYSDSAQKAILLSNTTGATSAIGFWAYDAGGSGWAERLEISGPGNITATTGNLVIGTSGKGIDFSATPGTGTSELLADYEQGTFTPTYTSTGTPPTVTYSHQFGKYIKIGNLVYFQVEIGTNSALPGTGLLAVGGLPFTAVNDRYTGTFSVGYATGFTTASPSGGYVFANETIARLTYEASATSKTEMLTTFLTNGAGQNYLVISGSYIV
jgi:hypothetical protein